MVNLSNLPARQTILLLALLIFFVVFGILSVQNKTLTTDESRHYQYGVNILNGKAERFDDSKMPFSALNALPGKIASGLPDGSVKEVLAQFLTARLMTILFSVGVALLVFAWTRSLYGVIPAFFALTLYIFDPNIIAHSQLVTTDIYATGTILFAFYCLWRFAHQRTWPNGLLCAFALGLSLVAKYTSVVLFPLFFVTLILYDLPRMIEACKQNLAGALKTWVLKYAVYVALAGIISIFVINVCFLFDGTFTRFGSYKFRSETFQSLQTNAAFLRRVPVPTPYPYLQGLDWVMQRNDAGFPVYFLGKVQNEGVPGYYFIAFLLKEPLATQLLIALAVVAFLRHAKRREQFLSNELFLLVPVAFFVVYFNFFYDTQIGLRFYLVIFPFLYIFAASLFANWQSFSVKQKWVSLVPVTMLLISMLSYYPYYLPYFNELVWDRTQSYKYLADSNLDWHQSYDELTAYLAQHPDARLAPDKPQPGHFIASVNGIVGLVGQDRTWLRENFEPDGTVAYSYLIYHISPEEIKVLCKKTTSCSP